jgi:Leucine-rich repeat (LRR) protein
MEQLKNLKFLTTLNMQFNAIQVIPMIGAKEFINLENLNLAYNLLTQDSIRALYKISNLKKLDLSSNNLQAIPADIKQLVNLECLNLAGNQFDSLSSTVNPSQIFKALGQIQHLKTLNLSRNRFVRLHGDLL